MQRSYLLTLCCIVLLSCSALAQTGSVKGKIITSDGKAADFISVIIHGTTIGATTDANGIYKINKIKPGTYTLKVSAVGLSTQEKPLLITAGQSTTIDFTLQENSGKLQEVIINEGKHRYKTDKVSSSLRLNEPLLEIPQNIQIVTSATLKDQQITSMSDGVIRNVSGLVRLEHWGDLYTRINTRGGRAAAFRNGMNVSNSWGPLTEDMSVVDHIEFVKGPAGFMMANGDPSGIYNVVTKKPTGADFNGEATFTLGSFDLYRTTLDLDGKFNKSGKLLYRLNVMGQEKNSFRAYEFNNRYSIAPVIAYHIDEQTTLTAEYTYQHVNMSNVGSAYVFSYDGYGTLPRNTSFMEPGLDPTNIEDHSLILNLQHKWNDQWKLTVQGAYFDYKQVGSSMFPRVVNHDGTIIRNVTIWDANSQNKFGQAFVNGELHTGAVAHRIIAGLDLGTKRYYADWNDSQALDTDTNPFNSLDPVYGSPANGLPKFNRSTSVLYRSGKYGNIDQTYSGLYLQDELGFFENKLRLTLAGRYTYVKEGSYGSVPVEAKKLTPRIGLSTSIDKYTSFYALYDQSFVPQTGLLSSGDDVKPITGNNMEIGMKKDWFEGKLNTTIAAYRILQNNQLTSDPSDLTGRYSLQLGQTRAQGIEFDVRGEFFTGFSVMANYAFTDSEISKTGSSTAEMATLGDKVAGYAKHNANLWLNYAFHTEALKGLGISGGASYLAGRTTWSWTDVPGQKTLPDYFKMDAGLFWNTGAMRITGTVFNVLDKYLYSGSAYGDGNGGVYYYTQAEAGRNYRLSIAYKF